MILVDSSVWIDFLRANVTPQTTRLNVLILTDEILVGDLILTEILQGCRTQREFSETLRILGRLTLIDISDHEIAVEAARNYMRLRTSGITVRKTIDTLIATRCIVNNIQLLHNDRDFIPFETHLGLRCVEC